MEVEEIKKKSRILLISEDNTILDGLKRQGYENIDHFKSRILASRYYEKCIPRLSQYHVIIMGSSVKAGRDYLDNEIPYLEKKYGTITVNIFEEESKAEFSYNKTISSFRGSVGYLLDKIPFFLEANHTLERNYIPLSFTPIPERENLNVIVPRFKSNLKVLYLSKQNENDWSDIVRDTLGVQFTHLSLDSADIWHSVLNSLGDFDIILGSNLAFVNLFDLGIECSEQVKKTGRCQTLLMKMESNPISELDEDGEVLKNGFASSVHLKYLFSTRKGEISDPEEINIPVLREDLPYNAEERRIVSNLLAATSVAVNLYDEKLRSLGYMGINDNDLSKPLDYQIAYEEVSLAYEEEKRELLKPIQCFDHLTELVSQYLFYQKKGLIKGSLVDLDIIEFNKSYIIESYYNERLYSILTIPIGKPERNYRTFKLQIPSKKGMLTSPVERGLYTPRYEKVKGIFPRPNDMEASYLLNLIRKVEMALTPLVEEVISPEKGKKRSLNRGQEKK